MLALPILALLTLAPQGTPFARLLDVDDRGDVSTLTITEDGRNALVAVGGALHVLDIPADLSSVDGKAGRPTLNGRVARILSIDATPLGIAIDGSDAIVAAGTQGLLSVSWDGVGPPEPQVVMERTGRACFDTAILELPGGQDLLLALFSGRAGNELQVLLRGGTSWVSLPNARVDLPSGNPFEAADPEIDDPIGYTMCVDEERRRVYVAMGTGGIVRVDFDGFASGLVPSASEPYVTIAPRVPFHPANLGFVFDSPYFEQGRVRDLCIAGNNLLATVDGKGVASFSLRDDVWPPLEQEQVFPLSFTPQPEGPCPNAFRNPFHSFAVRIESVELPDEGGHLVFVRGSFEPVKAASEGLPFVHAGRWTWQLDVGIPLGGILRPRTRDALYVLHLNRANKLELVRAFPHQEGREPCLDRIAPESVFGGSEFRAALVSGGPGGQSSDRVRLYRTTSETHVEVGDTSPGFIVQDFPLEPFGEGTTGAVRADLLAHYSPVGFGQIGVAESLTVDGLLLTSGEMGLGTQHPGLLRWNGMSERVDREPETNNVSRHGLLPIRAQWPVGQGLLNILPVLQGVGRVEAMIVGRFGTWSFQVLHAGEDPSSPSGYDITRWEFPSPFDADGLTGRAYFNASLSKATRNLALTRAGSRYGVLASSVRAFALAANGIPSCGPQISSNPLLSPCRIQPDARALDVHPEMESFDFSKSPSNSTHPDEGSYYGSRVLTMDARFFHAQMTRGPGLSEIAVVACGTHANDTDVDRSGVPDSPWYGHAMIALYDYSRVMPARAATAGNLHQLGPARAFAIGLASIPQSNAIDLEIVELGNGQRTLFVADFGGTVLEFDLSDQVLRTLMTKHQQLRALQPGAPIPFTISVDSAMRNHYLPLFTEEAVWPLPYDPIDGASPNVIDVEFCRQVIDGIATPFLLFTEPRQGLFRLELEDAPSGLPCLPHALVPAEVIDTAGLAHYLMRRRFDLGDGQGEQEHWILADKKNGIRVYEPLDEVLPD